MANIDHPIIIMSFQEKITIIITSNESKHAKLARILHLIVNMCNIDPSNYFILGSYAIRQYRLINDLDVNMDYNEFIKLEKIQSELVKLEFYNGQIRWFLDLTTMYNVFNSTNENDFSIEIFQKDPSVGFPNDRYSLKKLSMNDNLIIDEYGHQFFNFETLLMWKKEMNREKDKPDIEILEKLIS